MKQEEQVKGCACNSQIIWHFDQPTIMACENCEITFHYTVERCPHCGEEPTEFVKVESER
jgi:uncharacterized OB-fold protein